MKIRAPTSGSPWRARISRSRSTRPTGWGPGSASPRPRPRDATRRSKRAWPTRTSARWSGSCGADTRTQAAAYHPSGEIHKPTRPRRPAERRLSAALRDPPDLAVGRRPVPGRADRLGRLQSGGTEHDPRVRDRDAGHLVAVLDPRALHRRVHRPLVSPKDPGRSPVAPGRRRLAGAVRAEGGARAVLRRGAVGALGESVLPGDRRHDRPETGPDRGPADRELDGDRGRD